MSQNPSQSQAAQAARVLQVAQQAQAQAQQQQPPTPQQYAQQCQAGLEGDGAYAGETDEHFADGSPEEDLLEFLSQLLIGTHGHNLPDVLMEIKVSLDQIRESLDVNSKCQLKMAKQMLQSRQAGGDAACCTGGSATGKCECSAECKCCSACPGNSGETN